MALHRVTTAVCSFLACYRYFQIKKLKNELGVVRSNLTMMSDMMSQLDPVTVKQADMELLEVKKRKKKRWVFSHEA